MTVVVQPERVDYTDAPAGHVILRCRVTHPPSAVGRRVDVWIEPDRVDDVVRELRVAAAAIAPEPRRSGRVVK